ncbi:hypothetical protein ACNVED_14945 (plasmid) [Legionella sp. D16C41]|uniref:hypothetical protein n=1 Tax=Legionella sp. D16C41 TaxID=3402688 RepID=UPI003AF45C88
MTHNKDFKNESQDARRKDEHNRVHPDAAHDKAEKLNKNVNKSSKLQNKSRKS